MSDVGRFETDLAPCGLDDALADSFEQTPANDQVGAVQLELVRLLEQGFVAARRISGADASCSVPAAIRNGAT